MEQHRNITYRYERKFFVHNMDRTSIEQMVLHHPAFFSEIYHERYINNIYFDYPGFDNLLDNIAGNTNRAKSRIRWYGELFKTMENPLLELKRKRGLVGFKQSFPLGKFRLKEGVSVSRIKDLIRDSALDAQIKVLLQDQLPVLINRYRRKYYESFDRHFRITIDDKQSFYRLHAFNNNFLQVYQDRNNVIIELKYKEQYETDAAQVVNKLPFRVTKSSKYARGVELLYA